MSWTLWRGADLLGTVHKRSVPDAVQERKSRREVNAVLVPDPAYLPLQSVSQHVVEWGRESNSTGARPGTSHYAPPPPRRQLIRRSARSLACLTWPGVNAAKCTACAAAPLTRPGRPHRAYALDWIT